MLKSIIDLVLLGIRITLDKHQTRVTIGMISMYHWLVPTHIKASRGYYTRSTVFEIINPNQFSAITKSSRSTLGVIPMIRMRTPSLHAAVSRVAGPQESICSHRPSHPS